jgi:hypothetical protein
MVIPFVRRGYSSRRPLRRAGFTAHAARPNDPIPLVGHTDPWAWLLASSLKIDLWKLARFNQLMVREGHPVQAGRMFRDPGYAFETLATAHATGDEALMALALEMFEQYSELERRRRSPAQGAGLFGAH